MTIVWLLRENDEHMPLTEQQLWSAAKIDAKLQKHLRGGKHDRDILLAMADHMHRFKDRVGPGGMDQLARKVSGIQSGAIKT